MVVRSKCKGRTNGPMEEVECPLCIEKVEGTEANFYPCPCGYQVCLFCYGRLKNEFDGRCPGCRSQYQEGTVEQLMRKPSHAVVPQSSTRSASANGHTMAASPSSSCSTTSGPRSQWTPHPPATRQAAAPVPYGSVAATASASQQHHVIPPPPLRRQVSNLAQGQLQASSTAHSLARPSSAASPTQSVQPECSAGTPGAGPGPTGPSAWGNAAAASSGTALSSQRMTSVSPPPPLDVGSDDETWPSLSAAGLASDKAGSRGGSALGRQASTASSQPSESDATSQGAGLPPRPPSGAASRAPPPGFAHVRPAVPVASAAKPANAALGAGRGAAQQTGEGGAKTNLASLPGHAAGQQGLDGSSRGPSKGPSGPLPPFSKPPPPGFANAVPRPVLGAHAPGVTTTTSSSSHVGDNLTEHRAMANGWASPPPYPGPGPSQRSSSSQQSCSSTTSACMVPVHLSQEALGQLSAPDPEGMALNKRLQESVRRGSVTQQEAARKLAHFIQRREQQSTPPRREVPLLQSHQAASTAPSVQGTGPARALFPEAAKPQSSGAAPHATVPAHAVPGPLSKQVPVPVPLPMSGTSGGSWYGSGTWDGGSGTLALLGSFGGSLGGPAGFSRPLTYSGSYTTAAAGSFTTYAGAFIETDLLLQTLLQEDDGEQGDSHVPAVRPPGRVPLYARMAAASTTQPH